MRASSREKAEARGRLAELAALTRLRLKGYRLLARRFQSGQGEVDLIMRRGEVTAFIEVKARGTIDDGVTAVTERLPGAVNVHFCDGFAGGELHFDYRMRPGVVPHGNGLALMRAVGLGV